MWGARGERGLDDRGIRRKGKLLRYHPYLEDQNREDETGSRGITVKGANPSCKDAVVASRRTAVQEWWQGRVRACRTRGNR